MFLNAKLIKILSTNEIPNGLFVRDAQIVTSTGYQPAQQPVQLKGASISITAKKATGLLKVALVGLDGKDGRNGSELDQIKNLSRPLDPKLNGQNGKPGKLVVVRKSCPGGRNIDVVCEPSERVCSEAPQNGEDGRPGAVGTDGEAGQNGGNSGTLFVRVDDAVNFSIEVGQQAGRAGHGGQGGPGSPGGLGGKAGVNPGAPCSNAREGAPGKQGATGNNGPQGASGKLGTIDTGAIQTKVFSL